MNFKLYKQLKEEFLKKGFNYAASNRIAVGVVETLSDDVNLAQGELKDIGEILIKLSDTI